MLPRKRLRDDRADENLAQQRPRPGRVARLATEIERDHVRRPLVPEMLPIGPGHLRLINEEHAKCMRVQVNRFAGITLGQSPLGQATQPDGGDAEFAAWTMVARVLLNLDETITRE